jgi:hypothetical protein
MLRARIGVEAQGEGQLRPGPLLCTPSTLIVARTGPSCSTVSLVTLAVCCAVAPSRPARKMRHQRQRARTARPPMLAPG